MKQGPTGIEIVSQKLMEWTGSSAAFITAVVISVGWAVTGPFFHYSDTWQLVISTITNVATFLMVFLIQRSQNKDSVAINMKLNELVAAIKDANNHLISAENMSEGDLKVLQDHYAKLLEISKTRTNETASLESVVNGPISDSPDNKRGLEN